MFFLLLIFFSSSQISLNSEEILSIDPAFKRDMIVAGNSGAREASAVNKTNEYRRRMGRGYRRVTY